MWSDHLALFHSTPLSSAHKVKKDLKADLASRGLQGLLSAESSTFNSHPLLVRTKESQRVHSSLVNIKCADKEEKNTCSCLALCSFFTVLLN